MPTTDIQFGPNDLLQTPYAYLQAAGSTGGDGSTEGVHLRWTFAGSLGESHLPKGNLAQSIPYTTSVGFNKPNDYVRIYRVPYSVKHITLLDLTARVPDRLVESGGTREWEFDIPVTSILGPPETTTLFLRFDNISEYNTIRATIDPAVDPFGFMQQVTGLVEVGAVDKLSFSICLSMAIVDSQNPGIVRMEAVSENDSGFIVTCRNDVTLEGGQQPPDDKPVADGTVFLTPSNAGDSCLVSENIVYARFDYQNAFPYEIRVETYHDFLLGAANHDSVCWNLLDEYALTDDENEAHNRLDPGTYNLNENWPRFNDTDLVTGEATVSESNYQTKWKPGVSGNNDYIEYGVIQYLTLSTSASNLNATDVLGNSQAGNTGQFQLSYLEYLNLISLDFHIARMLGLGTIDADPTIGGQQFMYLFKYETFIGLEPGDAAIPRTHYYISLPTGKADERLPEAPMLEPVEYGLSIPATPNPYPITDADGYAPYEPVRFINLFRSPSAISLDTFVNFFDTNTEFCLGGNTQSVYFGIEYRKEFQQFVWPEISHDERYVDSSATDSYEVLPIAAESDLTKPMFIHQEREEGVHEYAIYGVNWFSRVSPLSNIVPTDFTQFPKNINLLPPNNFQVQLIQKEDPRIFTSAAEQQMLADIDGGTSDDDEILVRAVFEWDHTHNLAYQQANQADIFFRQEPPGVIRGQIINSVDLPDNKVEITLGPYITVSDGSTVTPSLSAADETRYVGGIFSADGKSYFVESADSAGPKFVLQKITETELEEIPLGSNQYTTTITYEAPALGDVAMVIENLSAEASWPNNLLTTYPVTIINYQTTLDENGGTVAARTHFETILNVDGSTTERVMGGIFETATVTEFEDVEDDGTGNPQNIPNSLTGVYTIEFDTYQLPAHPQTNVDFYKGTARILINNGVQKKSLEILEIDTSGATLKVIAVDNTFSIDPAQLPAYVPNNGYEPIEDGNGILVNLHPGYRVYLQEEAPLFDQNSILPNLGEGTRTTFMTIRSADTTANCESPIATPVALMAREIIVPLPPGEPTGPVFATRPGLDGKSTYTFDSEVNTDGREPFAMIFNRASDQTILDQLYQPSTIRQIRVDLGVLAEDEKIFDVDRWKGLVNADIELSGPDEGLFKTYHTIPGAGLYRFPEPDNDAFEIVARDTSTPAIAPFPFATGLTPQEKQEFIKAAIDKAFLPLTEEPLIYQQIEDGIQTSDRPRKVRNSNGDRMAPIDPDYDPAPMAVVHPPKSGLELAKNVRFTDYTLDGASINTFFYYSQEMSNDYQLGPRSPIAGPVRLVNSLPASSPQVIRVTARTDNPFAKVDAAIKFEINEYLPSDRITSFKIYRASKFEDAKSVRTMVDGTSTPIGFGEDLLDTFEDLEFPPYGEPIYYRLVAVRSILNELGEFEDVPSEPTEVLLSSIADVVKPLPPTVEYKADGTTNTGLLTLVSVQLRWTKVTHNATYILYHMDVDGNWVEIYRVKSNDSLMTYDLENLVKEDADGDPVYHRYRVDVINSSGIASTQRKELTI